jgi:hypothetical protein
MRQVRHGREGGAGGGPGQARPPRHVAVAHWAIAADVAAGERADSGWLFPGVQPDIRQGLSLPFNLRVCAVP